MDGIGDIKGESAVGSFLNPIIDDQAPDDVSAGGRGTADGIGDIKGEAFGPTFLDPDPPDIAAAPAGSTFLAPTGISMNIPD